MIKLIAVSMLLAGSAICAFAGTPVPEVDAPSGIAVLALVSGGLLVLRGRRRKL